MMLGLAPPQAKPQQINIGGFMSAKSVGTLRAEQVLASATARALDAASTPVVTGLVDMLQKHWSLAKDAKRPIEKLMLDAVRSRRGEYSDEQMAIIKQQGGSTIFMMLFATKARQLKALLAEIFINTGAERCWTISPSPKPDLPPEKATEIMQAVYEQVAQIEQAGRDVPMQDIRQALRDAKEGAENAIVEVAKMFADRAAVIIEDALVEGGWLQALDEFLDDLSVFKTAFIKGPVVRNAPQLKWVAAPDGHMTPQITVSPRTEFERVDPFMIYPAPWSKSVDHGYLFERHKLSRSALQAMIGIDGYSEDAIRAALDAHGTGGLHEWLDVDNKRASVEGRSDAGLMSQRSDLIDALQYWGSVSGKMLREWGMSADEIEDDAKEYEVEMWMVGTWVIKAALNPDPLLRRPYFADGFSRVPGAFWHNSLYDVVSDCQSMCNAAARALSNNMGIASGPQVVVNIDRLPQGEDMSELYPWKIHQVTSDPTGGGGKPIDFFQPGSNASELMGVFERFSTLADDFSGVPRYTVGLGGGEGGAGRTASGLSMQLGNASKQIKSQASSIDMHVVGPAVERQFQWEMLYNPDTEIKGDLQVQARGSLSITTKEAAQVRRNEFLMQTANPVDMGIIGPEGRAELLRESAKSLMMNPDKIVPSATTLKLRAAEAAKAGPAQAQEAAKMQADAQAAAQKEVSAFKQEHDLKMEQLRQGAETERVQLRTQVESETKLTVAKISAMSSGANGAAGFDENAMQQGQEDAALEREAQAQQVQTLMALRSRLDADAQNADQQAQLLSAAIMEMNASAQRSEQQARASAAMQGEVMRSLTDVAKAINTPKRKVLQRDASGRAVGIIEVEQD